MRHARDPLTTPSEREAMSDPNPPEQPSFNRPAGGDPTTPLPSSRAQRHPLPAQAAPLPRRRAVPAAPPAGGPGGMSSIPDPAREGAGFFTALFDFSFTNFVTPILVRFVYLLATVALVADLAHLRLRRLREQSRHGSRRAHPRADLRRDLPRRHPHDPRVLPLGRADERGHPQAPPPGLTAGRPPSPVEWARSVPARTDRLRARTLGVRIRRQRAGCCWVMQWMPPPRAKSGRASTVTTRRPG